MHVFTARYSTSVELTDIFIYHIFIVITCKQFRVSFDLNAEMCLFNRMKPCDVQ